MKSGTFPHVGVLNAYILAGNAAIQWLLIAASHKILYYVKRSLIESAAMVRKLEISIASVRQSVTNAAL